jgi:hypothetical protein
MKIFYENLLEHFSKEDINLIRSIYIQSCIGANPTKLERIECKFCNKLISKNNLALHKKTKVHKNNVKKNYENSDNKEEEIKKIFELNLI